jgi:hypothetical protein
VLPRRPVLLLTATACGSPEVPGAPAAARTLVNLSPDDQRRLIDFVSACEEP